MVGVALTIPGTGAFSPVGLDRIQHLDPLAVEGTLLYSEPRLWPMGGVPTSSVPNQSEWAVDLLGASAADLTIGNRVQDGLVERGRRGTLHVAWKRGAGTGLQSFTIQNQAIRDYIAANPTHSYLMLAAIRPTRIPAESFQSVGANRLMGFNDDNTFTMALAVNITDASSATGYPTGENRTFVQTHALIDDSSAAAGVVASAWSGVTGTFGSSSSLIIFANGGPGNPGMSWKYYFASIEDLTVSGRTAAEVTALANEKLARQLAVGGHYYDDTVTDPYTL